MLGKMKTGRKVEGIRVPEEREGAFCGRVGPRALADNVFESE